MTERSAAADGRRLGDRYRLEALLATGGMGEVWAARDLLLGRAVAVKVLGGALAGDGRAAERLRREARAAARLEHPGIARVLDLGEHDGRPYLVMELLEGESLDARIGRAGPMAPAEAARVVAAVADALEAAHRAGVVHRDVKPGNVFLTAAGEVKVLDFGIASAAGEAALTTGDLIGTAAYLAPERVLGHRATPAADVYALGVVLYELLAGRRPFEAGSDIELAMAHVNAHPPPLGLVAPATPSSLVAACEQAMAKDPAARPRSADAFAALLRHPAPAPTSAPAPASAPTRPLPPATAGLRTTPGTASAAGVWTAPGIVSAAGQRTAPGAASPAGVGTAPGAASPAGVWTTPGGASAAGLGTALGAATTVGVGTALGAATTVGLWTTPGTASTTRGSLPHRGTWRGTGSVAHARRTGRRTWRGTGWVTRERRTGRGTGWVGRERRTGRRRARSRGRGLLVAFLLIAAVLAAGPVLGGSLPWVGGSLPWVGEGVEPPFAVQIPGLTPAAGDPDDGANSPGTGAAPGPGARPSGQADPPTGGGRAAGDDPPADRRDDLPDRPADQDDLPDRPADQDDDLPDRDEDDDDSGGSGRSGGGSGGGGSSGPG
jgi:eukaryotic-like serine/threonine-protein kinase